jgi:hypothetical protein
MKMKYSIIPVLFLITAHIGYAQLTPIGQWREHLEFGPAKEIVFADDHFFVASKWGIYSVTYEDRMIERYSKINGLNDLGIKSIQYNPATQKLLIAYENSNLDVLYKNNIINIPYILKSNISGNKKINRILMKGDLAYLATGIGVIVVDMEKYEIAATWPLGNGGKNIMVASIEADNNFFYAATEEGLKRIAMNNPFPENIANWEIMSGQNNLPNGSAENVLIQNNNLFAQFGSQLYKQSDNNWTKVYEDDWVWTKTTASENRIFIAEQKNNFTLRRILVYNINTNTSEIIEDNLQLATPVDAVSRNNVIYVSDNTHGVVIKEGASFERISINSPSGPVDGEMIFHNNKLYVAGGSINEAWYYLYNRTGFFVYDNQNWKAYNQQTLPWMDTLLDVITLAVDPLDETIYAGSYSGGLGQSDGSVINGGGLIEIKSPDNYKIYKQGTPIEKTIGDNSYRVSGLAFDNERNLWFSNFGAERNFGVRKADGSWAKFSAPFIIKDNMVGSILIDDYNQKWIQVPQGNGIFCYNHGTSIDNSGDDRWKWLQTGKGNGNLPGNLVQAMAKDKDGFIWLGTDKGIGIIQCPGEVFTSNGCEAYQPIIQQGNFASLLFGNEEVRAIAVDGANRKWVGTKNGVWLISADGEKVIERFTEDNSPLLSNLINRIAIDPVSGEVYFSTFKGICSYRSTATEGTLQNEQVFVFPNPVPSGYGGQIGIRGLAANAYVKITELNGRLVYQTRAFGGQAVWSGNDYTGKRAATGVYLILVTDETGIEKTAGKIVFVK